MPRGGGGRRSSSSRSSTSSSKGNSWFSGSSLAPTKTAPTPTTTTTTTTTTTSTTPTTTQPNQSSTPSHHTHPHHSLASPQGGGMMSTVMTGIADGISWGMGSAIGRRMVDSIFGPQTVQVEHTTSTVTPSTTNTTTLPTINTTPTDVHPTSSAMNTNQFSNVNKPSCSDELDFWNRCMSLNNNSVDACSSYSYQLKQCQGI